MQKYLSRRDTFLMYDAWGRLTSQSSVSPAFVEDTSYEYTRAFKNDYAYDALGRRIRETETNRNGSIAQVDLYYDASGSVLQETEKTPAVDSTPAVRQYVWSAAMPGMMTLRDDTVDGVARRVWSMQGPDGSAWALYEQGSNGSSSVERISYTPTGLATFLSPRGVNVNAPSGYSFTDLGDFDWRFTWHGGRISRDQDTGIYGSGVVDRQSGLMFVGGHLYDSTSGTPLLQDKYAFFRPGDGSSDPDAHKLSARGSVNTQFMHNGSGPTWDQTFWRALGRDPVMSGMGSLTDNEATAFAYTFASEVGSRVSGMAQGIWNAVTSPIQTYNHVVDTTAAFVAQGMKERDARGWGGNSNNAMSAWEGAGYLVGSSIGANSLGEAGYGVGLMGNELSTEERWTRGFAGAGQMILTAAGLAGSYDNILATGRLDSAFEVYHGTSKSFAKAIREAGIDLRAGRANIDFGQGFYTSTRYDQALDLTRKFGLSDREILTFRVSKSKFINLSTLDYDGPSIGWGMFVRRNRLGVAVPHSYDVASGPVLRGTMKNIDAAIFEASGQQST